MQSVSGSLKCGSFGIPYLTNKSNMHITSSKFYSSFENKVDRDQLASDPDQLASDEAR